MADRDDQGPVTTVTRPRRPAAKLPRAVRFVVAGWLTGALMGLALAAVLIAMNTGGLSDLIAGANDKVTPVVLFAIGCATLVGGLWAAMAIMLIPKHERDND